MISWPLPPRVYAQETWLKWLIALGFEHVPLIQLEQMSDKAKLLETCSALAYRRLRGGDAIS